MNGVHGLLEIVQLYAEAACDLMLGNKPFRKCMEGLVKANLLSKNLVICRNAQVLLWEFHHFHVILYTHNFIITMFGKGN